MSNKDLVASLNLNACARVGISASQEAAKILLALYSKSPTGTDKSDGDWVTQADVMANRIIHEVFRRSQPAIAVVSEEDGINTSVISDPYWIVDPLDGTYNFISGIPIFGTSLALIVEGVPVVAIVTAPYSKQLFVAIKGHGAKLNNRDLRISRNSKHHQSVDTICYALGYEIRRHNLADRLLLELRAGTKRVLELWAPSISWCLVAQQKVGAMISVAPSRFDSAAGILILEEAGGKVSRIAPTSSTKLEILIGSANEVTQNRALSITDRALRGYKNPRTIIRMA